MRAEPCILRAAPAPSGVQSGCNLCGNAQQFGGVSAKNGDSVRIAQSGRSEDMVRGSRGQETGESVPSTIRADAGLRDEVAQGARR